MSERSPLHNARFAYIPKMPEIFSSPIAAIKAMPTEIIEPKFDKKSLKDIFTHSYGKPAVKFTNGDNILPQNPSSWASSFRGVPLPADTMSYRGFSTD